MIIQLTGEYDGGKTLAALGYSPLIKTALFHDDIKQVPNLEYGFLCNLVTETKGQTKFPFRKFVLEQIKKIPEGIETVVFDTWTRFGSALQHYVVKKPEEFIKKTELIMTHEPKVVGAQRWREAHREEGAVIARLQEQFSNVILVSHLKDHIIANVKTGKQVPDAGKVFDRICNLRLWLRHNPESGVPTILVLKRITESAINQQTGMLEVVNILPRKITPRENEKSVWEAIARYEKEPYGNRSPEPDEIPTPFELSILEGILTADEKEVWKANLAVEEIDPSFGASEQEIFAKELEEQGLTLPQIVKQVKEKWPELGTLGKVSKLLNG